MKLFTSHPNSVGESYFEHMGQAASFATCMIAAGAACAVHAVLPFLFKSTGRETILKLHERMVTHRVRSRPQAEPAQPTERPRAQPR